MFSPIRRSSLYLALLRFDIGRLQFAVCRGISARPGSHRMEKYMRDHRFTGVRGPLRRRATRRQGPQSQVWRLRLDTRLDTWEKAVKGVGMTVAKEPSACQTMTEVRAGVEAVDRDLVVLPLRRFSYMDAAARIKKLGRPHVWTPVTKSPAVSRLLLAQNHINSSP